MKGTKYFIIKLDNPFNETFKLESGVELYGNVDFTYDRQSNRIAKVVGVPTLCETEIKEGYEILIDPSHFYKQIYQGAKQQYQNLVDREKNLFYIELDLIACYRKDSSSEWIGFQDGSIVKPIFEEKKINTTLLLPTNAVEKKYEGKVKVKYINKELEEEGVKKGDTLFLDTIGGLKFWIEGVEYWWVRNNAILGKELANE